MKTHIQNSKTFLVATCLAVFFSFNSMANEDNSLGLGLSLKASTLGLGLEADYRVSDNFNLRLQANGAAYDETFEEDDITYTGEIDLSSFGLLADWRPFSGAFRLTGGAYSNSGELRGSAVSNGTEVFEIGDQEYRGSQGENPLTLNTSVALGSGTAGYFGLGWGNSSASGWMFSFDLGVLLSGAPEVDLAVSGFAERADGQGSSFDIDGDSDLAREFQTNVAIEEANLEEDISEFEFYPVISLGLGYRF